MAAYFNSGGLICKKLFLGGDYSRTSVIQWSQVRIKADFQSAEFSERAEILLFAGENVALKLNR